MTEEKIVQKITESSGRIAHSIDTTCPKEMDDFVAFANGLPEKEREYVYRLQIADLLLEPGIASFILGIATYLRKGAPRQLILGLCREIEVTDKAIALITVLADAKAEGDDGTIVITE